MSIISPLPPYLIKGYQNWKVSGYIKNKSLLENLADYGQNPKAMVISCCDSRVHVTSIFGAETGEFFIHRNIANIVPPYTPNKDYHGSSAAIEYAVKNLKVSHIIILGHSNCGGVKLCHDLCSNPVDTGAHENEFLSQWVNILKPGYEKIDKTKTTAEQRRALEKEGVLISLNNLIGFPFVKKAIDSKELKIHGLWNDIRDGTVEYFDSQKNCFLPLIKD